MKLVRRGVPLPLGAVRNLRSVLYIGNLMHALQLLVEQRPASGEIFFAADAEPLSTPTLIRMIGDAVGRPPILLPVPVWMLEALGRVGDVAAAAVNVPFTSQEVMRLTGSLWVDDTKLRVATGYQAQISTADGIRRMAAARGQAAAGR
jgi:nucleoside-diphosphate-sugar epimerase